MGCTNSVTYMKTKCTTFKTENGPSKPDLIVTLSRKAELTQHEKNIVKSTWHYITKDLSGNGLQVFLKIFELRPETKELFHVENVRHSDLARNRTIRGHGIRFMNAIGVAVDSLNDGDDTKQQLGEVLFVLGEQHKHYTGFRPEYFDTFFEALIWRWEQCMREKFTPEVADAWGHIFLYMMEKLQDGYHSPDR